MSKKNFIMPVLIKAGNSRMKKCFGEKIAAYDCYIVEAGNLNNLICERDRLQAERDELLATIKHIREYWNGDYNCMAVSDALEHIMETCDDAIEKAQAGAV